VLGCVPLVEASRDGLVESIHLGALAVVDTAGELSWSLGDASLRTFPRSSLKPFQLLPLVIGGGIRHFGFTMAEVAVMAASHSGEPMHVSAVSSILDKIGAGPEHLACGAHVPLAPEAAAALSRAGAAPSALHNNCSGKHAGMLSLARLLDAPLDSYLDPNHLAQRRIREQLIDFLGLDASDLPMGRDGCSAPAYAVPLSAMASGFARLAAPERAAAPVAEALRTIGDAMRAHPVLIGGNVGRVDTELMRLGRGLVAKGGAEGYFCVGQADGRGLALKILDGDAAARARSVAVVSAVHRLGWIESADLRRLADYASGRPITNWAGLQTGEVRAAPPLLADQD
jgi:L-asparaginase II